jgi:putative membrane protein
MTAIGSEVAAIQSAPMSIPIPNAAKGQEYLANERTFLAWIRTAIAVVSLGFVVARFSLWLRQMAEASRAPVPGLRGVSLPMGEILMVFGACLSVLAAWRYHVVNRQIEEDRVSADRGLILLVAVVVAVLAVTMAIAMVVSEGKVGSGLHSSEFDRGLGDQSGRRESPNT